jgi:hypothetical protein
MTDDARSGGSESTADTGSTVELTDEEARQVAAVVDVCLERGFDVAEVDRATLERARDRLLDRG